MTTRSAHDRTWLGAVSAPGDDLAAVAATIYATVVASVPGTIHDVTEFVTPQGLAAYDLIEAARAAAFGAATPTVSVVIVPRLEDPAAHLAVAATGGPEGQALQVNGTTTGVLAPTTKDGTGRPAYTAARESGGLVHVSGVLPLDANGDVVGVGDLVAQTAKIYANAAVLLAPFGLGLEDVVKTVEFVKPDVRAIYPKTGFVRKQHLHGPFGGGTGIVMDDLAHPDALMQVDFWASAGAREKVDCGWERYGRLTYNPGLRVGDDLFIMSGQAALDVTTEEAVLADDVVAQAEYTYRNIRKVLEHAGLTSGAVVSLTEYVCPEGWDRYDEVAAVRAEVFGDDLDCVVTTVGCSMLLRPEFLIEVDPMAVQL